MLSTCMRPPARSRKHPHRTAPAPFTHDCQVVPASGQHVLPALVVALLAARRGRLQHGGGPLFFVWLDAHRLHRLRSFLVRHIHNSHTECMLIEL
jgi:hypothetical protein